MRLKGIRYLKITPKEKIQLILGTNGSGKSSLLYELSPLPAVAKNYESGGSKTIVLEHQGIIYQLTSDFTKGQLHSFIRDGVELNPGAGTFGQQKELVQQHLGITPKIHEMMLGKLKFTSMSTAERKDWLTQLADANYEYAIKVYQRIKEQTRDITGALKLAQKKLGFEIAKTYSKEEVQVLEQSCQQLYNLISCMQEMRNQAYWDQQTSYDKAQSIELGLTKLIDQVIPLLKSNKQNSHIPVDLDETIFSLESQLRSMTEVSNQFYQEHEKLNKQFQLAKESNSQSAQAIDQKLQDKQQQLKQIESQLVYPITPDAYRLRLQQAIESVHDQWLPLLEMLNQHKDKPYTSQALATYIPEREQALLKNKHLDQQIKQRLDKLQGIVQHLKSLKNKDHTVCPNCQHQWIAGYDEDLYQNSCHQIEVLNTQLIKLSKDIEEQSQHLDEVKQYFHALNEIDRLMQKYSILEVFWERLLAEQVIDKDPLHADYLLNEYLLQTFEESKIQILKEEIQDLEQQKQKILDNKDLNYAFIVESKEQLEEKIVLLQTQQQQIRQELQYLNKQKQERNKLLQLNDQINALLQEHEETYQQSKESLRRTFFNDMLRSIQSVLARKEAQLQEIQSHQKTIHDLEKQIKDLSEQEQTLKLLAKTLSPTEGLIAEGLFGFMQLFVNQMNAIIKKIWSYPLVVHPCHVSEEGSMDLDYKFPVTIDSPENTIKDVSEGSSAMHEVIDLAFKITAMKALKLGNYPLFLDEFGSTMDPTHKAVTIDLINQIMEQDHFTQLFMVSHDSVQYGALSNIEVCVISEDNMMLPKGSVYNRHVQINED